jgi:hypothetical protein
MPDLLRAKIPQIINLLDKGVSIDVRTPGGGETLLHIAARAGNRDFASELLRRGAVHLSNYDALYPEDINPETFFPDEEQNSNSSTEITLPPPDPFQSSVVSHSDELIILDLAPLLLLPVEILVQILEYCGVIARQTFSATSKRAHDVVASTRAPNRCGFSDLLPCIKTFGADLHDNFVVFGDYLLTSSRTRLNLIHTRKHRHIRHFPKYLPEAEQIGNYLVSRHQSYPLIIVRSVHSQHLVGVLTFGHGFGNALLQGQTIWLVNYLQNNLLRIDMSEPVTHVVEYYFDPALKIIDRLTQCGDSIYYIAKTSSQNRQILQEFFTIQGGGPPDFDMTRIIDCHGRRPVQIIGRDGLIFGNDAEDFTVFAINPTTENTEVTMNLPNEHLEPPRQLDHMVFVGHFIFIAHRDRREISVFDTLTHRRFGVFSIHWSPHLLLVLGNALYVFGISEYIDVLDITSYLND